ncbi:MAG: dihydrolipoyl dehydrogenase [Gammaproteobacteria bacterium]|nr:dihydrolipoyl dehydrogenase [Gammaproteobacteria bacterium]
MKKFILLSIIAATIAAFVYYDLGQYLTLDYVKSQREVFQDYYQQNRLNTILIYFATYVAVTALSLPGAVVMTLVGGAVFGLFEGAIIISFASTVGASLAFLASRLILRDSIQKRFGEKLKTINKGIEKEGAFYLFTLRLIPAFPFFLINLLMGLTPMKLWKYFIVSQIGMLPGTLVYVNAGVQLGNLESLAGILSPELLLSFVLLGIFPLIAKKILDWFKAKRVYKGFRKPHGFDYNIIVIGAGSGGLVSAYIAAAVNAKVALIEKHKMGGDCLNTGCVPSKALIRSAKMLSYAQRAKEFGFNKTTVDFDFAQVMERVQRVISKIEPHDSVERYSGLGVDVYEGEAKILSPWEVQVNGQVLSAKNLIIATGARPFVPNIPGLDQIDYFTSDTIWNLRVRPEKLLVLGGGPIGSELTQAMQRLGAHVTVVDRGARIMGREDPDVSETVAERFRIEGITLLSGHSAKCFETSDGKKFLVTDSEGEETRIEFDQVLVALGRQANVTGFGLEDLGVKLTERGTIEADELLRTNFPNIYVCGDVTGPYQFTHVAAHQAWYAAVNALFSPFKSFQVDYSVIPWATYTDPEVARVGLNETEAQQKNIPYELTKYGIDDLDRAIADEEDHGFVKVLTVPGKDKILGVTIVGHHAGELIAEYVQAMKYNIGLNKILGTIHIYPTLSEANKYAAGVWKKAHKPEGLLEWVKRFHRWRRGGDST